jgi:hypothetical protein
MKTSEENIICAERIDRKAGRENLKEKVRNKKKPTTFEEGEQMRNW